MATVSYFLDTRKTDVGFGIIKLRVTHNRVQRDYSTKIKVTIPQFEKLKNQGAKLDRRLKDKEIIQLHELLFAEKDDLKVFIDGHVIRAENVIKQLGNNFDFQTFKTNLLNYDKIDTDSTTRDVIQYLNNKAKALKKNGQISHGNNFGLVAKSLSRFVKYLQIEDPNRLKPKKGFVLCFEHIDSDFLNDWAVFMRKYGKVSQKLINGIPISSSGASEATISIYSRALRTVFNEAIHKTIIDAEMYPFGKNGFVPPQGRNVKKALTSDQLTKLKSYQPEEVDSLEQRALDFWLFSYFGNGMNFTDILHLKKGNLRENTIQYFRQKTRKNPIPVNVRLNERMRETIERWGNNDVDKNGLLFPFLNGVKSVQDRKAKVHQFVKLTNKYMNLIGENLGFETKLNTYQARHSFATQLMRGYAPLNMIKEKLGHKKITTTENYLGSFEKEEEDKFLDLL